MRINKAKHLLELGGVAIGSMVFEFSTTSLARIAAVAGADFPIFDMEHTGWSIETIRMLMATAGAEDLAAIVRVPAIQHHLISRPLDVGAMGLMLPMVETEEQARMIVRCAKYAPQGQRSVAFSFAHNENRPGDVSEKMREANRDLLLIALVETAKGSENVNKIAATDGIDVTWIGNCNLANS